MKYVEVKPRWRYRYLMALGVDIWKRVDKLPCCLWYSKPESRYPGKTHLCIHDWDPAEPHGRLNPTVMDDSEVSQNPSKPITLSNIRP